MATKYKYILHYPDGSDEESEDIYNSYEDAESAALDDVSAYRTGGEVLYYSNPGDYPYDEDDEVEFDIIEIDD